MTKGRLTRTWPIAALTRPWGEPSERKKTASEIPMTSSGTTAGSRLAVSSPPRAAGRFSFIRPKAKAAPIVPAAIAETAARMRLFLSATVTSGLSSALAYQSRVRPRIGRLRRGEVAKENSTVMTTGR